MAVLEEMQIDPARETDHITSFIRSELEGAGLAKTVVGLSGGLDSTVVAFLCARAVGKDDVLGLVMPYRTSSLENTSDARHVAELLGVRCETIDITPAADALREMLATDDRIRMGNILARTRMVVLYDRSAAHGALVAGTGNRTEAMLGYTTLHGDSACGFQPIAHLYKCQVRQLGAYLRVPERILTKPPSADLWEGQTDEGELGFSYDDADWLLFNMLDKGKSDNRLEAMGFEPDFVARVRALIATSEFKRRMPNSLLKPD